MKRRAICLITVIALCLSLCPIRALAAGESLSEYYVNKDSTFDTTYVVKTSKIFNTQGYSYTVEGPAAVSVQNSASLYLTTGTIKSTGAAGVEVQSGFLCVRDPGMTVIGRTYGLDIFSGATAQLSGGTFTGEDAAIRAEDGNYAALLAPGCAYFDEYENPIPLYANNGSGDPIQLTEVAGKTTVMVKECTDHSYICEPDTGAPTHSGTCRYCGTAKIEEDPCKFSNFSENGTAVCESCGRLITVTITPAVDSFVYDGGDKTRLVGVEVILGDGTKLSDGTEPSDGTEQSETPDYNYTVEPSSLADVGEFTVTVTGVTYEGTFTKKFRITEAELEITWKTSDELSFDYEVNKAGLTLKIEAALLSKVTIAVKADENAGAGQELTDVLKGDLKFYYKERAEMGDEAAGDGDDTGFTEGLPTDAGTYQIKAVFPGQTNYKAASSSPIILKINKIDPIKEGGAPTANTLTYDGTALELVTRGEVWDGAVILFAVIKKDPDSGDTPGDDSGPEDGAYSESIPTGTDAGTYDVWYKVKESKNYNSFGPQKISGIKIERKEIEPIVELGSYSYLYDGGEIRPDVTVMEPGTRKVLPDTEYTVEYSNNINVGGPKDEDSAGTATDGEQSPVPTVTVKDKAGGNYSILPASAYFTITAADQAGLTITNLPGAVSYGDVFTLGTFGGSGNGTVKWKIIAAKSANGTAVTNEADFAKIATVNPNSGQVTVTGVGTVTVQATKSGTDNDGNHKDATATWTFTADPRRVTATVTAGNKTYDGTNTATVTAVVEQGVVPGDTIMITGLSGTFKDENAGTNKPVTVTGTAVITVNGDIITNEPDAGEKYFVTIPGTATADIFKAATEIKTVPTAKTTLTYTGEPLTLLSSGASAGFTTPVENTVTPVEYALSKDGAYTTSYEFPKAANAGTYQVWYRVKESANYLGTDAAMVEVTIRPKEVTPVITLPSEAEYNYVYDGSEKRPSVTVKDVETVISSSEYTVTYSNNVNAGTNATVTVTDNTGGNYTVNGSKTFEIKKAKAGFTSAPVAKPNLTYNGTAQALVSAGVPNGGTAVYWLEGESPSAEIPTGTDCRKYTVHAKVLGDANHEDSDEITPIEVAIGVNEVKNPTVELSSTSFQYNGNEQKPTITVKDDKGNVIPSNEYTVTYEKVTTSAASESVEKTIDVGTYTIKIKSNQGSSYNFTEETHTFSILPADQTPLEITGKPTVVRYGDTIQLSTTGGTGNGTVTWEVTDGADKVEARGGGQFIIKGVGNVKIKATRTSASDNYADAVDTWEFYAEMKPITAIVTAEDKTYDGEKTAVIHITWENGALINGDAINTDGVTGEFEDANAGTNKTVNITGSITSEKYDVTIPETAKASIFRAEAKWSTEPKAKTGLVYNGTGLELVSKGTTENNMGTVLYRLDEAGEYSPTVPTVIDANYENAYKVYYKVEDGTNWTGIGEHCIEVVVKRAEPTISANLTVSVSQGSSLTDSMLNELIGDQATGVDGSVVTGVFTWADGTPDSVEIPGSYEVLFTPDPPYSVNYRSVTITVNVVEASTSDSESPEADDQNTITPPPTEEPGTENASTQTTVRDGASSTVVSAAAGNQLVNEAVASGSKNVIIKPEITGDVTKAEVSIPASAVGRIGNETDAALTVSTPIADVTIPNGALDALSNAGGTVSVVAEQVENTVVLTLTANGRDVGNIPGGLTLTVPVEDAGPGTVAVLVYEDGTRETVRKSVAGNGGVRIPLNGSATVEIVDNSKEFTDVPAESWAADAVAFASAHEMFNGTGEATFSPERTMSRAMLATVLYNLEGQPDQSVTGAFGDINSGSWYAESVSWAAENGIVTGYGNGSFGANDSITREQLAVMLWRYAGSPTANEQSLGFTDADQASGYAMEALCWAAENGILNGYGNGRIDPTGLATRAQAAQMLKNFIENT